MQQLWIKIENLSKERFARDLKVILLVSLFLIPILPLLPHLDEFPFQPLADYSDFSVSHFPNLLFLQQSLRTSGSVPLWSPLIFSGYPFAADPLSGVFYLPGWLALAFSLPAGINITVLLHIVWGGVGFYFWQRHEGLPEYAALFSALTFEALPKVFSHLGAGHVTLIYALSWTPWLLYAEHSSFKVQGWRKLLPGLALGLMVLADLRWAAFAGILWIAYGVSIRLSHFSGIRLSRKEWALSGLKWLQNALLAGCLAAPLIFPFVEYLQLSTRRLMTAADRMTLSLPPVQLIGMIYPNIGGEAEWITYVGAVVLGMSFWAVLSQNLRKKLWLWFTVAGVSLIYALGSNLPFVESISALPGLNMLRVPPRALFLTGLAAAVIAGGSVKDLVERGTKLTSVPLHRTRLVLFSVYGLIVFLGAAVTVVVPQTITRIQFLWGTVFNLATGILLFLALEKRIRPDTLLIAVFCINLVDLVCVNGLGGQYRSFEQVVTRDEAVIGSILDHADGKPFRVYSPSYSIEQQTAAWYHLELAGGVDPMQLNSYVQWMQSASGIPNREYSVTLPPYTGSSPSQSNRAALPDLKKFGLLNVRFLVSAYPIEMEGLTLIQQVDQTWLYQNERALPRAWVQRENLPPGDGIQSTPDLAFSADDIQISARGQGLLVLSEIAYPGWKVTVDGKPAALAPTEIFRAVRLEPGVHQVRFSYQPVSVMLGILAAGLAWLGIFGLLVIQEYRR
jgi:hypothetical protein